MTETKKSLGQHWLNDKSTLEAIVAAAEVTEGDKVLEIGPGKGALTDVLLENGADVLALEFDQDLIGPLKSKYANCKKFAISFGDIRSFDFGTMPSQPENYKIVANIPYYLTSHLIRSLSETPNPPQKAVLLIQKEVAQRICAGPGQMGILSVVAQFYFECSLDVEAPAHMFTPPPKVDSQVVVLTRRSEPLYDLDTVKFFTLVKAGFSNKRKTLRNSLSGGLRIDKEKAVELLEHSKIDPALRAQQLSLSDWNKLYVEYNK